MADIRVLSLDLDGSFMGVSFVKHPQRNIIEANIELLNELLKGSIAYHQTYVFVGSNRQSIGMDETNSKQLQVGSGFPRIKAIADYLGAKLDKFLLADLFYDKPDGYSFDTAEKFYDIDNIHYNQELFNKHKATFPECIEDTNKMILIYAQMHKIASQHPNDTITFKFFDDKESICKSLYHFYSTYPQLIPKNVCLEIYGYEGPIKYDSTQNIDTPVKPLLISDPYPAIQGTGLIDDNFRTTIKEMTAAVIESAELQAANPIASNFDGKPIYNYADAANAGFYVSSPIDYASFYKPGMTGNINPTISAASSHANIPDASKPWFYKQLSLHLFGKLNNKSKNQNTKKSSSLDETHFKPTAPIPISTQSTPPTAIAVSAPASFVYLPAHPHDDNKSTVQLGSHR